MRLDNTGELVLDYAVTELELDNAVTIFVLDNALKWY